MLDSTKIDKLPEKINDRPCPMAVVDYLDTVDGFGLVKANSPRRYGTRGMRHVAIYKLKVIALNKAALAQGLGGNK
jgi:hypothetical protein